MADPESQRTLVVVATYNERGNLVALLDAILAELPQAHVLVVDDNSPDGTGEEADLYALREPRVTVLHRPRKQGLGSALLDAFRQAIALDYDLVATMDADFSHPPRYLPALVAGMDQNDVMIGSRYVTGGGIVGWNWTRHLMSHGINLYTRVLLGVEARDCSGGFRCYRVAKLREIDFDQIASRGYSFMEEFLYRCQQVGCRLGETPIVFENRKFGKSKINAQEAVKALWILWRVGMGRLGKSRRAPVSGRTSAAA